jgi:hypothetical protein
MIQEATTIQSLSNLALSEKKSTDDIDSDSESASIRSTDTTFTKTAVERGPIGIAASKVLVIKVDDVSLATFCVMLYYIYTGEIDCTVVPSRFVLSNTNKTSLVWSDSAGKIKDSIDWQPLGQDSPWRLKDVTWKELKDAAVRFGLKDLQAAVDPFIV